MSRVSSVVLFLLMLLTTADVVLRKLANQSILGTVELTEFLLIILIFFIMAQTEIMGNHVKVDLVMVRFGRRTQNVVDTLTQLAGFVLVALITWSSFFYAGKMRAAGEVSQDLWIPVYPFVYVVAVGCLVYCLVLLINFFKAIQGVFQP